jgi:sulfur relay (sulfurtransferase) complex TusBCD TusD component (DsrE family)
MFALSLLDLVAYLIKDGLLSLLANIKIDRSINRKLYCFVTKMAKLNLVVHVCLVVVRPRGVSNKRWARKLFVSLLKILVYYLY